MVKSIKSKKAIAMIELIFALVIIGIVLMSAPMLIQQSIQSSNVALQQEAIVAAASQTAIVLSMHWDENNSHTAAGRSPILDTNRVNFDVKMTSLPSGLNGVHGRTANDGIRILSPSTFGPDATETGNTDFDDVDDYNNSNFGLMLFNNETTTSDVGEYVDTNISIRTTVRYTQENDVSTNTIAGAISNIKFITVNLKSNRTDIPELEKDITFEAFSCNIGTYAIYGRELP